jgi:hypothetical protein
MSRRGGVKSMNKEGRAGEGMKSRGMTDNGVLLVGVA